MGVPALILAKTKLIAVLCLPFQWEHQTECLFPPSVTIWLNAQILSHVHTHTQKSGIHQPALSQIIPLPITLCTFTDHSSLCDYLHFHRSVISLWLSAPSYYIRFSLTVCTFADHSSLWLFALSQIIHLSVTICMFIDHFSLCDYLHFLSLWLSALSQISLSVIIWYLVVTFSAQNVRTSTCPKPNNHLAWTKCED